MLDCSDRERLIGLTLLLQQDITVLVLLESKTIALASVSEKLVYGGWRFGCYLNNRADTFNFN